MPIRRIGLGFKGAPHLNFVAFAMSLGLLCSRALKRRIISSLPAFEAMRAARPTMKNPKFNAREYINSKNHAAVFGGIPLIPLEAEKRHAAALSHCQRASSLFRSFCFTHFVQSRQLSRIFSSQNKNFAARLRAPRAIRQPSPQRPHDREISDRPEPFDKPARNLNKYP
jgi:hypothetical protein